MAVKHQQELQQFVFEQNGVQAKLQYQRLQSTDAGSDWVDFYHTFVPETLRGGGVAAQLTSVGVQWAEAEGLRIRASCSYVSRFLQRRAEK